MAEIVNSPERPSISFVIPLYNEKESLEELYRKILQAMEPLQRPFEIIFVDDGSTDGSAEVLERLHQKDSRVKVIQFRRNFGNPRR